MANGVEGLGRVERHPGLVPQLGDGPQGPVQVSARLGVDEDSDRDRFTVSDNGIVVIGKDEKVPPDTKDAR